MPACSPELIHWFVTAGKKITMYSPFSKFWGEMRFPTDPNFPSSSWSAISQKNNLIEMMVKSLASRHSMKCTAFTRASQATWAVCSSLLNTEVGWIEIIVIMVTRRNKTCSFNSKRDKYSLYIGISPWKPKRASNSRAYSLLHSSFPYSDCCNFLSLSWSLYSSLLL